MSWRNRKCREIASGLPGGLSAESFVQNERDDCAVKHGEQATHVVEIQNRMLLRFKVVMRAECSSSSLHYSDGSTSWKDELQIGMRPSSGGARVRNLQNTLTCDHDAMDDCIEVAISYEAIGCNCSGSTAIQLQVDAIS